MVREIYIIYIIGGILERKHFRFFLNRNIFNNYIPSNWLWTWYLGFRPTRRCRVHFNFLTHRALNRKNCHQPNRSSDWDRIIVLIFSSLQPLKAVFSGRNGELELNKKQTTLLLFRAFCILVIIPEHSESSEVLQPLIFCQLMNCNKSFKLI